MATETNSSARILQAKWLRLFPIGGIVGAAVLLSVIGAAGYLTVGYIKQHAELLVYDTLGGLADSSWANANLVETFNCMTLAVMTDDPAQREHFRRQSEIYNNAVSSSITAYSRSIYAAEDRANYDRLLKSRMAYVENEKKVLALVDGGQSLEARHLFKTSLLPAYRDYRAVAEKVMKYNADEGRSRGQTILRVCTLTQISIAGVAVLLFITGFVIGMFK